MKYVLVNGRTPSPQALCSFCCEPIGERYLRELATHLSFCDRQCYAGHSAIAARAMQKRAKAS